MSTRQLRFFMLATQGYNALFKKIVYICTMQNNKQYTMSALWVLTLHAITLAVLSLFRTVQYAVLGYMINDHTASVAMAFIKGLWFDNVIACYISVLPLFAVLSAAAFGCTPRLLRKITMWWYGVLGGIAFMVSAANIPYFAYFFKNINSSIFEWFGYAATTTQMVTGEKSYFAYIALFFVLMALYIYAIIRLYRWFNKRIDNSKQCHTGIATIAVRIVVLLVLTALCVFGIRGRRGYNPIKISQAYYCNDAFLNQLGINPAFNLLTSVLDDQRKENKELKLMPYAQAISAARQSLAISGECDSLHVLRRYIDNGTAAPTKRNVVIILMESMSANFLGTFGNTQHLTPTLDSLYNHSLAFTRCYSAGIHTNHGMTATLYSLPALMFRNLMKGTVTPHRTGIPTMLHSQGYRNMFFMPHEAQYDNMKAFFTTNGYDEIFGQEDYPESERVNAFGVSDHFLFDFALNHLNSYAASNKGNTTKPFFATILTVSNHPPFIVPEWFKPHSKDTETQIVEYADWCIGKFLKKARQQPWYDNTIFVVAADHGKIVGKVDGVLPQSYNHIPLLIFGAGVKPQRIDSPAMQVDVMPTLLSLLGMSYSYDGFGVDLTTTTRPQVFYSADNQIVARTTSKCYIYEPKTKQEFCYNETANGELQPTTMSADFLPLKNYVFAMIQTAQYIIKQQIR